MSQNGATTMLKHYLTKDDGHSPTTIIALNTLYLSELKTSTVQNKYTIPTPKASKTKIHIHPCFDVGSWHRPLP